jgi:hypothetical protein
MLIIMLNELESRDIIGSLLKVSTAEQKIGYAAFSRGRSEFALHGQAVRICHPPSSLHRMIKQDLSSTAT